jgi:uncharacterized protein with NRDE domain
MCILALSFYYHINYKFILVSNRDEFINRKTAFAKFNDYGILSPKDLKMGGTWIGITKKGRFAILTNYRKPELLNSDTVSRGILVKNYLESNLKPKEWLKDIKKNDYNPFNIIFGYINELYYFNNIDKNLMKLQSGIYTLSNGSLNEIWPKCK